MARYRSRSSSRRRVSRRKTRARGSPVRVVSRGKLTPVVVPVKRGGRIVKYVGYGLGGAAAVGLAGAGGLYLLKKSRASKDGHALVPAASTGLVTIPSTGLMTIPSIRGSSLGSQGPGSSVQGADVRALFRSRSSPVIPVRLTPTASGGVHLNVGGIRPGTALLMTPSGGVIPLTRRASEVARAVATPLPNTASNLSSATSRAVDEAVDDAVSQASSHPPSRTSSSSNRGPTLSNQFAAAVRNGNRRGRNNNGRIITRARTRSMM